MSKSKPCFEILGKKAFRWHLETWKNQIGSIFKLNIKKGVKFQKKKIFLFLAISKQLLRNLNFNIWGIQSQFSLSVISVHVENCMWKNDKKIFAVGQDHLNSFAE